MDGILIFLHSLTAVLFALHIIVSHCERRDLFDRITGGDTDGYLRLSASADASERTKSKHKTAVERFRKKGNE